MKKQKKIDGNVCVDNKGNRQLTKEKKEKEADKFAHLQQNIIMFEKTTNGGFKPIGVSDEKWRAIIEGWKNQNFYFFILLHYALEHLELKGSSGVF